jgi:hypothetical protein
MTAKRIFPASSCRIPLFGFLITPVVRVRRISAAEELAILPIKLEKETQ